MIRVEHSAIEDARVATVWLDRPDRLNGLCEEMWRGLRSSFEALRGEIDVRVVFVRSTCDRAFCVGLDLTAQRMPDTSGAAIGLEDVIRGYQAIFDMIEDHPVPVVAALHGYVLGGGLELAMACDLRVAADDAQLGLPEAHIGFIAASGGTQRLPKYVGLGRAKYMLLTGERIGAEKALAWGLVDDVVSRTSMEARLEALTHTLLRGAPRSHAAAKELARRSYDLSRDAGGEAEAAALAALASTEDVIEGFGAFIQKRPPRWTGR